MTQVERWSRAINLMVQVVDIDDCYLPIFGRADRELKLAIAESDPVGRARARFEQGAKR